MSNLEQNNPNEIGIQPSNGKDRVFRNPSGRTGRSVPDLRVVNSVADAQENPGEASSTAVGIAPQDPLMRLAKPEKDFCWAHVTGSYRRERSIEGLLLGVAVGDAVGLGRSGLSRRSALRMFGRGPLHYCLIPGIGIASSDTHRMLMTLQSVLRSRSQLELFRRNFAMRLRFYLFSLPVLAGRATVVAAIRLCLGASAEYSGVDSTDNSPLINGLTLATVLQGTGHSVERWVAVSSEITHVRPEVIEAAVLIARTTYLAIMTDPQDFSAISLVDRLIGVTEDPTLRTWLQDLRVGLEENLGTHSMACRLGWKHSIPSSAGPTAIMAIYSWLRHHDQYEKVLERAVLLGGDSVTLGALAGGLAGIHLGAKKIPERWLSKLWAWPNSRRWMDSLTFRFTDWPHGSEDLLAAPALPPRAMLQLIRSGVLAAGVALRSAIRIPWKLSNWIVGC